MAIKSRVYSLGIIMLELQGFFQNKMLIYIFANLKSSQKGYSLFEKYFSCFYNLHIDEFQKRVLQITKNCIEYYPTERIGLNELKRSLIQIAKEYFEYTKCDNQILSDKNQEGISTTQKDNSWIVNNHSMNQYFKIHNIKNTSFFIQTKGLRIISSIKFLLDNQSQDIIIKNKSLERNEVELSQIEFLNKIVEKFRVINLIEISFHKIVDNNISLLLILNYLSFLDIVKEINYFDPNCNINLNPIVKQLSCGNDFQIKGKD